MFFRNKNAGPMIPEDPVAKEMREFDSWHDRFMLDSPALKENNSRYVLIKKINRLVWIGNQKRFADQFCSNGNPIFKKGKNR